MEDLLLNESMLYRSLTEKLKPSRKLPAQTLAGFLKLDVAFDHKQILPPEFYDFSKDCSGFGTKHIKGINSQTIPYLLVSGKDSMIVPLKSQLFRRVGRDVLSKASIPLKEYLAETGLPRTLTSESLPGEPVFNVQVRGKATSKKRGLILLHGWNGNGLDTWKGFPQLLKKDFPDDHIILFNYPSGLWGTIRGSDPTPAQIAEAFRTFVETEFNDCDSVIILAHSLGGVIARKYIVDEIKQGRSEQLKVQAMILYGTPFDGHDWDAVVGILASRASQAAHVRADSSFLLELQADWARNVAGLDWDVGPDVQLAVPTYAIVGLQDTTVSERSASCYSNRVRKVLKDHQGLVKPTDKNDQIYKTTLTLLAMVKKDLSEPRTIKTFGA